ncbi:MAG: helix-turn-helix domain-containing protein [Bifidobacterium criceti]|nr:helix-turn-helix domain-containing protein [Bifidobacterium criceti]
MSLRALTWTIYDVGKDLTDTSAYRTLLILADHCDDDGCGAYPSAATIAEKTGMSVRTVRAKLKILAEAGYIVPGDQRIAEYLPANRRPKVWNLNMNWGAESASQNKTAPATADTGRRAESAPQNDTDQGIDDTDSGGQQGCSWGAAGVKQGCSLSAHKPIKPIKPIKPREYARETEAETTEADERRLASWAPNAEARAYAIRERADVDAEADKFRCRLLATGHVAKNLDAAFNLWMRRGSEGGYLAPARHDRPSDTRVTPSSVPHRHRWNCEHVKALMGPHEGEYSHERAGGIGASEWMLACQETADRLNHDDGIPDIESTLADPATDTGVAALADGSMA